MLAAIAAPSLKAYSVEAHLLGAGRAFKGEFLKARSIAVKQSVYTAIRFERDGDGTYYSVYADGNLNGVRTAEINSRHRSSGSQARFLSRRRARRAGRHQPRDARDPAGER